MAFVGVLNVCWFERLHEGGYGSHLALDRQMNIVGHEAPSDDLHAPLGREAIGIVQVADSDIVAFEDCLSTRALRNLMIDIGFSSLLGLS